MHARQLLSFGLVLGPLLSGGCRVADDTERRAQPAAVDAGGVQTQPGADAAAQQRGELRFEVSLARRELHVYRNGARVRTYTAPASASSTTSKRRPELPAERQVIRLATFSGSATG